MSALNFRGSYGFPSHGIASIRVITRDMVTPQDFAFIGDSVGFSITDSDTAELPALLDGVFATNVFDAVGGRCTASPNCIGTTGVQAAQAVPNGTEIAIVELGYNDPSGFAAKIDQVMSVLRGKGVSRVGWVTMSERRTTSGFAAANQALNAARARWPELVVLDWNQASSGADRDRWFADDVHLTTTGQSEFALWLRGQTLSLATAGPGKLGAGRFLRVRVAGVGGVPVSGVTAVALNVTAVDPSGWGSSRCGRARCRCRWTRRTSTSWPRARSSRTRCSRPSTGRARCACGHTPLRTCWSTSTAGSRPGFAAALLFASLTRGRGGARRAAS